MTLYLKSRASITAGSNGTTEGMQYGSGTPEGIGENVDPENPENPGGTSRYLRRSMWEE